MSEPAAVRAGAASADSASLVSRLLHGFDRTLEAVCIALVLGSAGVATLQVFRRYVLNAALSWPEELCIWMFSAAVFLGMALVVGRRSHISIDLLKRFLPPRGRQVHGWLVDAVVAAASFMLLVHGWDFAGRAIQVSPALQWPLSYLLMVVPAAALLNLFYLVRPFAALPTWRGAGAVLAGLVIYLAVRHGAGALYQEAGSATALMVIAFALILFEVPVAFALMFGAFAAFAPLGDVMLVIVPQNVAGSLNSFTLLAIPFFIMAAAVMNVGGITVRLLELATRLVGHFRGGLGQANVVTNTLLAGVSGSSTADASAIAKLMVPEMEHRGYDRAFSCALTSAASTLANLIPPSLGLIIYAALASVSVGAVFVATIVPGLLAAGALVVTVHFVARQRGYGGDREAATGRERLQALKVAVPALLLPLLIVGGVRIGAFTATEAGAMALIFAVLCGLFFYRCLTARNFLEAARESTYDTVTIVIIIAAAAPFAWVLAAEQVPQKMAAAMAGLASSAVLLLLLVNLFLLGVGLFMEMIAAMVILVPILVPIVVAAGVSPVQFGVVLVMNLVIGALTPPMGMLVFTTARAGGAPVLEVFRAILPFLAALICVLFVVTYVPWLTLGPVEWLGP
jgi:tripartite ATP-independent transporter DctM subunit